jgi:phosphatidylinositol glycan class B
MNTHSFLERRCDPHRSQLRKFLLFVALACSVRVTSAITWAFLFPPLLWQLCQNRMLLRAFIADTIFTVYVFERLFYTVFTHVMM